MIEETGTIVEIKENQVAVVLCKKNSLCETCTATGACRIGGDDGTRFVDVQNALGAHVGDEVRIATSTRSFLQSSFLLYVVPLIFLLIGAGVGQFIGQTFGDSLDSNLLSALLGLLFMAGAFCVIRVVTRNLPPTQYLPYITEILEHEDLRENNK